MTVVTKLGFCSQWVCFVEFGSYWKADLLYKQGIFYQDIQFFLEQVMTKQMKSRPLNLKVADSNPPLAV